MAAVLHHGATVDDDQMTGLLSIGTDWIPPATMPTTKLYVPGVLPGDGARVLTVVSPGENDALVNLYRHACEMAGITLSPKPLEGITVRRVEFSGSLLFLIYSERSTTEIVTVEYEKARFPSRCKQEVP